MYVINNLILLWDNLNCSGKRLNLGQMYCTCLATCYRVKTTTRHRWITRLCLWSASREHRIISSSIILTTIIYQGRNQWSLWQQHRSLSLWRTPRRQSRKPRRGERQQRQGPRRRRGDQQRPFRGGHRPQRLVEQQQPSQQRSPLNLQRLQQQRLQQHFQ